jgi:hypothetical protein
MANYTQKSMVYKECSSCSCGIRHSVTGYCSLTCQLETENKKLRSSLELIANTYYGIEGITASDAILRIYKTAEDALKTAP